MRQTGFSVDDQLRLLRVFHYTITELPDRELDEAGRTEAFTLWASRFPAADDRLSREMALTLTYTQHAQAAATILAAMPQGDEKRRSATALPLRLANGRDRLDAGAATTARRGLRADHSLARWHRRRGEYHVRPDDGTVPESERANVYKWHRRFPAACRGGCCGTGLWSWRQRGRR